MLLDSYIRLYTSKILTHVFEPTYATRIKPCVIQKQIESFKNYDIILSGREIYEICRLFLFNFLVVG